MKIWQKIIIVAGLVVLALSCRNAASTPPRIEKIAFAESAKTLYVGETVTVAMSAEPVAGKKTDKIEYRMSEQGVIAIKEDSGNDGVVFEGLRAGTTIITATVNGIVDYCSVTVNGGGAAAIPYITVSNYVMEVGENERRSVIASLSGGTPVDNSGFIWSYTNQRVISMESTGNVAVFDTLGIGESVITISHPKAQFSVDVLVYVLGNGDIPIYITTNSNVINLKTSDSNYQYEVSLRNGSSGDNYGFSHKILDGPDVIGLTYNNGIGTISPKSRGVARISVEHNKAPHPLEIVVIVSELTEYSYIDINRTLIIMGEGGIDTVVAEFIGSAPSDVMNKYSFEIEDSSVISIIHSQNLFTINALKRGKSVLKIKNTYADFDREVLVLVDGTSEVYDNEIYISTSQNVITTQIGADDILLYMTLVGGNEADRNNFVWTVDDGSVIEVESMHGRVEYRSRSLVTNVNSRFEAQAVIRAKKVGTATITLENPKAKNTFSVIVKVYARGTFDDVPVVLGGNSLYKVQTGSEVQAQLQVISGDVTSFKDAVWESDNLSIFTVEGTSGLAGILKGIKPGIATLRVSGTNVKHDYSATVIVGDDEYFDTMPYMYVRNPYISVIRNDTVSFYVDCENMTAEQINNIKVVNNNGDLVEVLSYRNSVVVTGLALGEAELFISSGDLNTLRVVVMVEDYAINPDAPFYLRTEKYIYGIVLGQSLTIEVDLVGGSVANQQSTIWTIKENPGVVRVNGNGTTARLTAESTGQTVLLVDHPKSQNEPLEIVVYVVESEAQLSQAVVIYVKENNLLLTKGEMRYVSIITNANDVQRAAFSWNVFPLDIIGINISEDRLKAYIAAESTGSGTIKVSHSSVLIPAVIYISVVASGYSEPYISVPSIIEMAVGDSLTVNAVLNNIGNPLGITWKTADDTIISAHGNGANCIVTAHRTGSTVVNIEYAQTQFSKNIVIYVYENAAAIGSSYILASEQSRYVINRGDMINVSLVFGMKGFPEHEIPNISWAVTSNNNVAEITGNGRSANIRGTGAGVATVKASSNIANSVEIEIVVLDENVQSGYWFSIDSRDKIKGLLLGTQDYVTVRLYNGNSEVLNATGITYKVVDESIATITNTENNIIRIQASNTVEGQTYIEINHLLAGEARILVYTTKDDLNNYYPIMVDKQNYLLSKGENINIKINVLEGSDPAKLNNIHYYTERGIVTVTEMSKKEIIVAATQTAGSDVVLIRYNGEVVVRIYVSVVDGSFSAANGYLVTENIIGILLGRKYVTQVNTDYSGNVVWRSSDSSVAGVLSYEGKTATLAGYNLGRTTFTVTAGDMQRVVAVFVCSSEAELKAYQAINVEQRQYKIRKGENLTISVASWQGDVEGNTTYRDYYGYTPPYGNVIEVVESSNNKLSVKGINEGIATVIIENSFYGNDITLYVEVYPAQDGSVGIYEQKAYITATKTLYVIEMAERNVSMSVAIAYEGYFDGGNYWIWGGHDTSIISLEYNGSYATVNPLKEGRTEITVSNRECSNQLIITVIVGNRYDVDEVTNPYIWVESSVYEVNIKQGVLYIPYNVYNVENFDPQLITVEGRNDYPGTAVASNEFSSRRLKVEIYGTPGIARFVIVYGTLRCEVYVLVKETVNSGNVFLTTSENYVILNLGELRTVNVRLSGSDSSHFTLFKWTVKSGGAGLEVVGNGDSGQLYGAVLGDWVVGVTYDGGYELTINVKVVQDSTKVNAIYLTTQRNVIETVAGNSGEYIFVQQIGGTVSNNVTDYVWSATPAGYIELGANEGTRRSYTPLKAGVVQVSVWLASNSSVKLNITMVISGRLDNGVIINTQETLIVMKPGDPQRRITVWLENSEESNNEYFEYDLNEDFPYSDAVSGRGGKVISSYTSNRNELFINVENEGTCRIKVTNPGKGRAGLVEQPLYITVYVTRHNALSFSVNSKAMVQGANEFIGINLPTYEYMGNRLKVQALDAYDRTKGTDVISVYNSGNKQYTSDMILISAKEPGIAVVSAWIDGSSLAPVDLVIEVFDEYDPSVVQVVVEKTFYNLNMRSGSITINALLSGPNVIDRDHDAIMWTFSNMDVIGAFPSSASPNEAGLYYATGRQVQINPKALGNVIITLSHGKATSDAYNKQIAIIVSESNHIFTIPRDEIHLNSSRAESFACNIVGGTTRDYNDVVWLADMQQRWDGSLLEVVRIVGSGKEVLLYPMNDGKTYIHAIYDGAVCTAEVIVESEFTFNFRVSNIYMYPNEVRELIFDVTPKASNIRWIVNTLSKSGTGDGPVIIANEVLGSGGVNTDSSVRYIRIQAMEEGQAQIIGMANNKIDVMTVYVQFDYRMTMDYRNKKEGDPTTPWGTPYYDQTSRSSGGSAGYQEKKSHGRSFVNYMVYPPDTYIKLDGDLPPGLEIEIVPPEYSPEESSGSGVGQIIFTGYREMWYGNNASSGGPLVFRQYKNRELTQNGNEEEETGNFKEVEVMYKFDGTLAAFEPYFVRGDGKYSNSAVTSNTSPPQHRSAYQFLKQDNQPTGPDAQIYESLGTATYYTSLTGSQDSVSYNMTLGDGEEHYILFDKEFDNSSLFLTGLTSSSSGGLIVNSSTNSTLSVPPGVKAELVTYTSPAGVTQQAIRISGGKDYIQYSRVAFNKDLLVEVDSASTRGPSYYEYEALVEDKGDVSTWSVDVPYYYIQKGFEEANTWLSTVTTDNTREVYFIHNNKIGHPDVIAYKSYFKSTGGYSDYNYWVWNYQDTYRYYFTGTESTAPTFQNILNDSNFCVKTTIRETMYLYTADVIANNRNFFGFDVNGFDNEGTMYTSHLPLSATISQGTTRYTYNLYRYKNTSIYKAANFVSAESGWTSSNMTEPVYYADIQGTSEPISSDWKAHGTGSGSNYSNHDYFNHGYYTGSATNSNYSYSTWLYATRDIAYEPGVSGVTAVDVFTRNIVFPATKHSVNDKNYVNSVHIPVEEGGSSYKRNITFAYDNDKEWQTFYYNSSSGSRRAKNANSETGVIFAVNGWFPNSSKIVSDGVTYFTVPFSNTRNAGIRKSGLFKQNETKYGANPTGNNIFKNNQDDSKFGQWSSGYRVGARGATSTKFLWWEWDESVEYCYFDTHAFNRVRWVPRNSTIIVPYYVLNTFPFRYEWEGDANKETIVGLSSGGGIPMPSLDRTKRDFSGTGNEQYSNSLQLKVQANGFNFGGGAPAKQVIINITFERRYSHMNYVGTVTSDNTYNDLGTSSGFNEIQGEITDYTKLEIENNDRYESLTSNHRAILTLWEGTMTE